MIAVILALVLLAICWAGVGIWGTCVHRRDYWKGEIRQCAGWFMFTFNIVLSLMAVFSCFRWQIGTDVQTGYIYSVEEKFGRGTVHMRMSLAAGEDKQKAFCVDGENLEKARKLAGSKKVRVTIPETGLHFENDYFACTSEVIIEELKEE